MASYRHILYATDLLPENEGVAERALELAQLYAARLSLLHVVESIAIYMGSETVLPDTQEIEAQLIFNSKQRMAAWVERFGFDPAHCHVEEGASKAEILGFAAENGVDLIIIGSHGRHGLQRLLGSIANSVMHSAKCDVLAVRVK